MSSCSSPLWAALFIQVIHILQLLSLVVHFDVTHGRLDLSMTEELLHLDRIFAILVVPSGLGLSEVVALHALTIVCEEQL